MVSLIVLSVVLVLIAVHKLGPLQLKIWQIMLGGSSVVVIAGEISPGRALGAINGDVMLFLFGMFALGRALEASGDLAVLAYRLFGKARTVDQLLLRVLFGMGLGAAVLMNDTLAIVGTPVVLHLVARHNLRC